MQEGSNYTTPDIALLDTAQNYREIAETEAQALAVALEARLADNGVSGHIIKISPFVEGTCYVFKPFGGITQGLDKTVKKIAREVEPNVGCASIFEKEPGIVQISVHNKIRYSLRMGDIVSGAAFRDPTKRIPWAMGWLGGDFAAVHDLADISAVLAIGFPRANTAQFLHTLIISLLYRFSPQQCRVVLINTAQAELGLWNDMPHLWAPIVRYADAAASALRSVVDELDSRHRRLADAGLTDVSEYTGNDMPRLVVIADELRHLMTGETRTQVEDCICRIAQQGKALGIHLVVATRRDDIPYRNLMLQPADDILTAPILDSFGFRVILFDSSQMNLDGYWQQDIWTMSTTVPPTFTQMPHIDATEIKRVADFVCSGGALPAEVHWADKALYERAKACVLNSNRPTLTYLQRCLQIGYNKACDLMEWLEAEGVVSEPDENGKRYVCVPGEGLDGNSPETA